MDLGGLWRGEYTVRRVAALAANLPPGSQVWAAQDHDLAWTTTDYLLAVAVDRARTTKEQEPVPRPADTREARRRIDVASAKADKAIARMRATQQL